MGLLSKLLGRRVEAVPEPESSPVDAPIEAPIDTTTTYQHDLDVLCQRAGATYRRRIDERQGLIFVDLCYEDGTVLVGKGATTKEALGQLVALAEAKQP